MSLVAPAIAPAPARGWRAWLRGLNPRTLGWVIGLAVLGAALLNPIFKPSFLELSGRTVFVALTCLLAFSAAGHWQPRWLPGGMPRWLVQSLALALAAPLATLVVYLVASRGDIRAFVSNEARLFGFLWISVPAILVGLVLALGSLLREREAQARTLRLQLDLHQAELARQAVDARLALLTAQIEPHFLFNTLANVQALVETGSPRAPEVLRSLIAYLRAALPRLHEDGGLPSLGNELALVRAYLELMHLRMPDRLRYAVTVAPGVEAVRFPAMSLLTLVENAVRHGIDPAEDGGLIEVSAARADDGTLLLRVADTGVGMAPTAAPGTGLANLRERLASVYGSSARLELTEVAPHGVCAEIRVPPPA
ncbi:sensor histidine kinase [Aquabacterium sp. OR-4]|uniref:sensor histidine kinase n=1 Tax=Aquabacterium sp. OR-4 TaxID=2978127 RepID=UPI0021B36F18|nr:histidine kinase [Aquabacterium sp. OR-4]MDT7836854.1 histidine kinase [Aquabacterium sp. OR-4]